MSFLKPAAESHFWYSVTALSFLSGIIVAVSGFGVPPKLELLFGGSVTTANIFGITLIWANRYSILRLSVRRRSWICIVLLFSSLLLLLTYIWLYDMCVISSVRYGKVFFPLWLEGELANIVHAAGSRSDALERYGTFALVTAVQRSSSVAWAGTLGIFLIVYTVMNALPVMALSLGLLTVGEEAPIDNRETAMPRDVKLFISHAHADADIAERLITALELAMNVPTGAIRCTSVPGYKLDLGAMAPVALRQELASAEVVIGILTPHSLASQWVLFELGAAWSQAKEAIPLLAGGLKDNDIPGPFRGAAGGQLGDVAVLGQLLEQLTETLKWPKKNSIAANGRLSELATYIQSKSFFDDDVEREIKAAFAAKRARIGKTQGAILDYITHNRTEASSIPQRDLYEQFKDVQTGLYYRLEQLRFLGFLSRHEIGRRGEVADFEWSISKKYKDEIG